MTELAGYTARVSGMLDIFAAVDARRNRERGVAPRSPTGSPQRAPGSVQKKRLADLARAGGAPLSPVTASLASAPLIKFDGVQITTPTGTCKKKGRICPMFCVESTGVQSHFWWPLF